MSDVRASDLPEGWAKVTVGEICTALQYGYTASASNKPVGPRFLRITDIQNGDVQWPSVPFCEIEDKTVAKYELHAGDIVFARTGGTVGKSYIIQAVPEKSVFASYLIRLSAHSEIHPKFLYHFFQSASYWEQIGLKKGGLQGNVNAKALSSLELPLCPLNEQKDIASKIEELFSELDKGIESLTIAKQKLAAYRQAVLKYAIEGTLTAQWRDENKDRFESSDCMLERIAAPQQPRGGRQPSREVIEGVGVLAVNRPKKPPPSGWSWVPLLRIARQETGHTPSRNHPEYWGGDQFWIGIADARLFHGKEIHDTIQKVTQKGLDNSSARTLPARTVCLSRTASVGYVCMMAEPMATSQDFATWTCTDALHPKFLMYALMAEGDEIRRFGKGTTHTTIYFPEIRALNICLPPIEEQKLIVDTIESKLQLAEKLEAEIDAGLMRCASMRQSILKSAFAGKLVEQDPTDEPASVLLERIKAEKEAQVQKEKAGKARKKTSKKKGNKKETAKKVGKRKDAA